MRNYKKNQKKNPMKLGKKSYLPFLGPINVNIMHFSESQDGF